MNFSSVGSVSCQSVPSKSDLLLFIVILKGTFVKILTSFLQC